MTVPDALASTAAVTAVAATSIAIAGRLGIRGFPDRVLAALVLAAAQIVLTVEALSLLGSIGRAPLLAVHATLALALVRGLPRPAAPWRALRTAWTGADLPLRLLAIVTAAATVTVALHAALVPVRHDDSITYHLPRIALYLQQRSLDAFPTPDLRQTALPANAEILTLWQMAVSGRNAGAPFLQLIAWLGTALGVYRLARHVGAGLRPAAFAGLAFASLPAVVLQTTAAQNDLTTAFFVVCALVFAGSGLADRRRADLMVAGAALGLALGTKATALLATPALAFVVLAGSARAGRVLRREVAWLGVSCVAGFLLLGSYFYAQNLRRYGHATGSAAFADLGALPRLDPQTAWSNLVRLGLRLSEPAGLVPPGTRLAGSVERAHARFAASVRERLGVAARQPYDFMKGEYEEHGGLPIDADITT
ncbi:MAG: glycosyltransferase family 39 protein, partial [Vicinamibacteria bacterium]